MFWQIHLLLLGTFTPITSYARVLSNRDQACGTVDPLPANLSKFCPGDSHCNRSELATQATPVTVTKLPRHGEKCDPLGLFLGNPSKWCPDGQYCDPFQWLCKPQLATRAKLVHAENTPVSEWHTSLSSSKEYLEISRRELLAAADYEPCPSQGTIPRRCPVGQFCQPFTQVCKPVTQVGTEDDEVAKPLPAISKVRYYNPSRFLPKRCPPGQYCDTSEHIFRSRSHTSIKAAVHVSLLPATQYPSPDSSLDTPEGQTDTCKRSSSDYVSEQPLCPDAERSYYGRGAPSNPVCPAGQNCDRCGHMSHRPQESLFVVVRTISITSVIRSPSSVPGRVSEKNPISILKRESLSNSSQQELHHETQRRCYAWGERGGPEMFCPAGQYCDRTDYICRQPQQTVSMMALTTPSHSPTQTSFTPNLDDADRRAILSTGQVANYSERELPPYDQRECYPFGDYGGIDKWCPTGEYCDVVDYVCRSDARVASEVARTVLLPSLTNSGALETHTNYVEESFGFPTLAVIPDPGSGPGPSPAPQHQNPGIFTVVGLSGVPAMHAALMPNRRVFFLDKVENYSPISLGSGRLAFSSEFDPGTRQVVPLAYSTNAFCSAGTFLADGRVISVGGNGPLSYLDPTVSDGFDGIRYLERSANDESFDGKSWSEPGNKLASKRWYASAQTMPDGSVFVASGSLTGLVITDNVNNNPTYEILDANAIAVGRNVVMDILVKNQPYYLYPFIHLLRDGSLFVFSSKSSQIFNVGDNRIVRQMPDLVGLYRTYPNSGGSVMLPLTSETGYAAEVIICGGGAFVDVTSPTEASCGRIQPESDTPTWEMDTMPEGRVMVEGTLLPDGTVLWLNGAQTGAQGFGIADEPALEALIYDPEKALGQRWSIAGRSEIPRLYHSVAVLLLDGTVLVAGGNPNEQPVLPQNVNPGVMTEKYPTEYRVEIYTPPYLVGDKAARRPEDVVISTHALRADGSAFEVTFKAPQGGQHDKVVLSHGGFVTHGLHMGQRIVVLDHEGGEGQGGEKKLQVHMPETRFGNNVLPPGPYVLYVVVDGVPSIGQFVMVE